MMKPQDFNHKIWQCNDQREKNVRLMNRILVLQELVKKDRLTSDERCSFITSLNYLTEELIKATIENENEALELLKNNGFETRTDESREMDDIIEEVVSNSNELQRIKVTLKNGR